MVWRLNSLSSSSLIRAQTPSPKSVRWDDDGGPAGRPAGVCWRCSLRMMSWRKSSAVSAVCRSSGKLPWMPFLLLAAEGRVW